MRDLEREYARWRAEQMATTTLSAEAIEELESHLRESVESLADAGLSNEEALLVAERRLGRPRALESDLRQMTSALDDRRLRWLLAGLLGAILLPMAARFAGRSVGLLAYSLGVPHEGVIAAAPVVGIVVLAALGLVLLRMPAAGGRLTRFVEGTGSRSRHRTAAIAGTLVLLGGFAANLALSVGAARLLAPEAFGYSAMGMQFFGLFVTGLLPIAGLFALARRTGSSHTVVR